MLLLSLLLLLLFFKVLHKLQKKCFNFIFKSAILKQNKKKSNYVNKKGIYYYFIYLFILSTQTQHKDKP
jgi:hypothetical protein